MNLRRLSAFENQKQHHPQQDLNMSKCILTLKMPRIQSKITRHVKNWKNFNRQKEKAINRSRYQEDTDVKIISDFKAAIIKVLQ